MQGRIENVGQSRKEEREQSTRGSAKNRPADRVAEGRERAKKEVEEEEKEARQSHARSKASEICTFCIVDRLPVSNIVEYTGGRFTCFDCSSTLFFPTQL